MAPHVDGRLTAQATRRGWPEPAADVLHLKPHPPAAPFTLVPSSFVYSTQPKQQQRSYRSAIARRRAAPPPVRPGEIARAHRSVPHCSTRSSSPQLCPWLGESPMAISATPPCPAPRRSASSPWPELISGPPCPLCSALSSPRLVVSLILPHLTVTARRSPAGEPRRSKLRRRTDLSVARLPEHPP